jgi:hypothetical protein
MLGVELSLLQSHMVKVLLIALEGANRGSAPGPLLFLIFCT